MNVFRLAGDMTHLLSVVVLLLKIHTIKSCAGNTLLLSFLSAPLGSGGLGTESRWHFSGGPRPRAGARPEISISWRAGGCGGACNAAQCVSRPSIPSSYRGFLSMRGARGLLLG